MIQSDIWKMAVFGPGTWTQWGRAGKLFLEMGENNRKNGEIFPSRSDRVSRKRGMEDLGSREKNFG